MPALVAVILCTRRTNESHDTYPLNIVPMELNQHPKVQLILVVDSESFFQMRPLSHIWIAREWKRSNNRMRAIMHAA